jgi:hypothetical protein
MIMNYINDSIKEWFLSLFNFKSKHAFTLNYNLSEKFSGRDKMFVENGYNVRICYPSRGRTASQFKISITM